MGSTRKKWLGGEKKLRNDGSGGEADVPKRKADEKTDNNEAIFMASPDMIGYDATGRKTASQLDDIVEKFKCFQEDATPFFV